MKEYKIHLAINRNEEARLIAFKSEDNRLFKASDFKNDSQILFHFIYHYLPDGTFNNFLDLLLEKRIS